MAPYCHAKNIPPKAYLMQFWGGIYARLLTGLTLFLLSFPLSSRGGGKCSAYSDQKSAAQTQDFHEYLISVCLCVCVLELRSLALETSKRIYVPQKSGRRARRLKSNRAVDLLIEKVNRVFPLPIFLFMAFAYCAVSDFSCTIHGVDEGASLCYFCPLEGA